LVGWVVFCWLLCVLWGGRGRAAGGRRQAGDFRVRACITRVHFRSSHFVHTCNTGALHVHAGRPSGHLSFLFFTIRFCPNQKLQIFPFSKNVEKSRQNYKNEISITSERYVFAIDFWRARGFVGFSGRTMAHNPRNLWALAHFCIQPNLHHFIAIDSINEDTTINQWNWGGWEKKMWTTLCNLQKKELGKTVSRLAPHNSQTSQRWKHASKLAATLACIIKQQ